MSLTTILILLFAFGMIAMHLGGHRHGAGGHGGHGGGGSRGGGGCGGHGHGHGHGDEADKPAPGDQADRPQATTSKGQSGEHDHASHGAA